MRARRALLTAVLLLVPSAAAAATPPVDLLDTGVGRLSTDGRYAAWWSDGQLSVRVLDTRTGMAVDYPTPTGCGFRGIGAGTGLWTCGRSDDPDYDEARLLDLGTATVTTVSPGPALPGADLEFAGVGSHWLSAVLTDRNTGVSTQYLSRDTGSWAPKSAATPEGAGLMSARRAVDLSFRDLARPMCRPLRRRVDRSPDRNDAYLPYEYEPPYGLSLGSPDNHVDPVLQRCDGHDRRLRGARSPQLLDGVLTWVDARGIHASMLRRRIHRTWDFPNGTTPATVEVAHTATRLFLRVANPQEPLFEARLPR